MADGSAPNVKSFFDLAAWALTPFGAAAIGYSFKWVWDNYIRVKDKATDLAEKDKKRIDDIYARLDTQAAGFLAAYQKAAQEATARLDIVNALLDVTRQEAKDREDLIWSVAQEQEEGWHNMRHDYIGVMQKYNSLLDVFHRYLQGLLGQDSVEQMLRELRPLEEPERIPDLRVAYRKALVASRNASPA